MASCSCSSVGPARGVRSGVAVPDAAIEAAADSALERMKLPMVSAAGSSEAGSREEPEVATPDADAGAGDEAEAEAEAGATGEAKLSAPPATDMRRATAATS